MSNQRLKYDNLPSLVQVWPPDDSENDVEVEIIAVHGLGANPATTWVKNGVCWLSDPKMLPAVVPNARIWTFNFESKWLGRRSTQNLESLGSQLRRFIRLTVPEVEGQTRPIVFVAHSFGGLLVAQALTLPSSDHCDDQLLGSVKGIVFLGTPFRGSHAITHARRIALAARALGFDSSETLLEAVIPGSEELNDLTYTFSDMANDRKLNISCFFEELRTNVLKGSRPLKMLGSRKPVHIVPKEMGRLETQRCCGLNASHTEMNEFDSPKDGNYLLVSGEIREIVKTPRRIRQRKTLFSVPYPNNREFVGREDVLDEIRRRIDFEPTFQTRLAIWGLGGIGKTQIATRYAYSIKDVYLKDGISIFFIRAATRERFSESYMKLASNAGIKLSTEAGGDNLRAVANWLENGENGRWLMILDNADDIDLFKPGSGVSDYIPQGDHGSILITSRDKRVCDTLAGFTSSILIGKLSLEDSRSLFKKHLPQEPLNDAMDQLITKMEYHPLALMTAVRCMSNNWIRPTRWLQLHDENEPARMELLGEDGQTCQVIDQEISQQNIATAWVVSFNQIRLKDPNAADMLAFMSFLDRQDIPRELLPQGEISPLQFDTALGTLQSYAMITESSNRTGFDMHGLIQLAMRNWLRNNHEASLWLGMVLKVLSDKFPTRAMTRLTRFWPLCRRYIPHALAPLQYTEENTINSQGTKWGWMELISRDQQTEIPDEEEKARKLFAMELMLQVSAWFESQGEEYVDTQVRASRMAEAAFGVSGPYGLAIVEMVQLESEYRSSGMLEEVDDLRRNFMKPYLNMLGNEGPGHIAFVQNMAYLLSDCGWKDAAISLRRRLVELNKGASGPESIESLTAMLDYASELGATEEGISSLEEVVRGFDKVVGDKEFATITARGYLCGAYCLNERWTEALELCLRILEGHQNILGPNNPTTLTVGFHTALLYEKTGQLDEARKLNLGVLKTQKGVLGPYHVDTRASQEVFERLNPGSMWRHQFILKNGLNLDEESERLIAGMEECSNWKGRLKQ